METNDYNLNTLTASEVTNLWNTYMNDSGAICHLKYELELVEDEDIRSVLQFALEISEKNIAEIKSIFTLENYPIPHGFTLDEDVDITAPRLFTDVYFLYSVSQMGKIGIGNFSMALASAVRDDVFQFFNRSLNDSLKLVEKTKQVLLSKGLYTRSPFLPKPESIDYVEEKSFLSGYFKEQRPLTGSEIMNLYANYERNALGAVTMIGYSQVTQNKEVTDFFIKGKEIANKHCEIFSSYLKDHDISAPTTYNSEITDSTTYVFSDKKMMFYATTLTALSIAYYGSSIAQSPRRDIGTMYSRLIAELLKFADEGTRLMIKNGWLEEPPRTVDRNELAHKNNK
ncbi:DUF3231 family protein [Filobacillus milosensis]|uniref:DUF3231 family protein n=1 Tax=Filobacillus milosensis TaxID=94137 RepID=A0A4Y8II87_9BACI|nr:DUF3231 family protein [Filobacillus milosensis]TFB18541.1 DUF3231 family protein [Filobacillus milosensis]